MDKTQLQQKIQTLIKGASQIKNENTDSNDFKKWKNEVKVLLINIFPKYKLEEFDKIPFYPYAMTVSLDPYDYESDKRETEQNLKAYAIGITECIIFLESLITEINDYGMPKIQIENINTNISQNKNKNIQNNNQKVEVMVNNNIQQNILHSFQQNLTGEQFTELKNILEEKNKSKLEKFCEQIGIGTMANILFLLLSEG